jgi:hypothetical protein
MSYFADADISKQAKKHAKNRQDGSKLKELISIQEVASPVSTTIITLQNISNSNRMNAVLSTERIAIEALQNASRKHTTQAVRLLAKHYGFNPEEALAKVGLTSEPFPSSTTSKVTLAAKPTANHAAKPTAKPAAKTPQGIINHTSKLSRDDVVERLLRGDDPVPVLSSDEDTTSDTKHAPKPRLTALQNKTRSNLTGVSVVTRTTEPRTRFQVKMPKKVGGKTVGTYNTEADAAVAYEAECHKLDFPYEKFKKVTSQRVKSGPSPNKQAQKTAVKVMKAALKALKGFDKEASKAAKDAGKAHKVLLKKANQDAVKATKGALKSIKESSKQAAKHAKVKSPKKSAPVTVTPSLADVAQLDAAELEEEELEEEEEQYDADAEEFELSERAVEPEAWRKKISEIEEVGEEEVEDEEQAELDADELEVVQFDVAGTTYYKSITGEMFDMESSDPVGRWCDETKTILEY